MEEFHGCDFGTIDSKVVQTTITKGFFENFTKFDKAIIVDLGGTLAHRGERPKKSYKTRFLEDSIDPIIRDLVNLYYEKGVMVIILTGQGECSREITTEWLNIHGVKFHSLIMKNSDRYEIDTLLFKKIIYTDVIKECIDVLFVLEDREDTVEMWRDMHVKCLQPASGQDREYYSKLNKEKRNEKVV